MHGRIQDLSLEEAMSQVEGSRVEAFGTAPRVWGWGMARVSLPIGEGCGKAAFPLPQKFKKCLVIEMRILCAFPGLSGC